MTEHFYCSNLLQFYNFCYFNKVLTMLEGFKQNSVHLYHLIVFCHSYKTQSKHSNVTMEEVMVLIHTSNINNLTHNT